MECKFFHTMEGSAGFAVMTHCYQFFVVADSSRPRDEIRVKKLADLPCESTCTVCVKTTSHKRAVKRGARSAPVQARHAPSSLVHAPSSLVHAPFKPHSVYLALPFVFLCGLPVFYTAEFLARAKLKSKAKTTTEHCVTTQQRHWSLTLPNRYMRPFEWAIERTFPFSPRFSPVQAPFWPCSRPVLLEQAPVERPFMGIFLDAYMYNIHVHVLMRDERRKEERSKQDQTNNKTKQHSTPKVVTESRLAGTKGFFSTNTLISRLRTCIHTEIRDTCTCDVRFGPSQLSCLGSSVGRALCLEYRVSWVRVPPEAAHFF